MAESLSTRIRKLSDQVSSLDDLVGDQDDTHPDVPVYQTMARMILFCMYARANPEAGRAVLAGLDPDLARELRGGLTAKAWSPGEYKAVVADLMPLRRQDVDALAAFSQVCREQEHEQRDAARDDRLRQRDSVLAVPVAGSGAGRLDS